MWIRERDQHHYVTVWPLHVRTMESFLAGFKVQIKTSTYRPCSHALIGLVEGNEFSFLRSCARLWPEGHKQVGEQTNGGRCCWYVPLYPELAMAPHLEQTAH